MRASESIEAQNPGGVDLGLSCQPEVSKVSGCELRGSVADFMLALAPTPLVKVHARACGLRGAMPRLENLPAMFIFSRRNETRPSWDATLRGTLQAIDLSENSITGLSEELPAASQVRLQRKLAYS